MYVHDAQVHEEQVEKWEEIISIPRRQVTEEISQSYTDHLLTKYVCGCELRVLLLTFLTTGAIKGPGCSNEKQWAFNTVIKTTPGNKDHHLIFTFVLFPGKILTQNSSSWEKTKIKVIHNKAIYCPVHIWY